ncbi:hypothetical protein ACVIF9_008037 [Bradyrhizobium sp. USDA 4350]
MLKYIYRVQGLPKEELNGREVSLITRVSEPHPNLVYLRSEPRKP